ncbi:MAG: hypothetical protein RBR93_08545 [Aliarcobacter butzleri]|nr:hypothetical protein [Aliarcobacter butzleri]
MRDFNTKIDNDNTSAGVVVADEYNSIFGEAKNVISPFMGLSEVDSQQMIKSIDIASKANFYYDTGSVNVIELTRSATTQQIETLFDGMMLSFMPAIQNTGATTLKIKNLTPKNLFYNGVEITAGFLKTDTVYTIKYSTTNDRFDILKTYTAGAGTTGVFSQGFVKPNNAIPLFVKASPASIKIPTGTSLIVGENTITLSSDYTLSLNSDLDTGIKTGGTDYYVYAKANGTFYISANDAITADRLIGGFHYGLTGEAEAVSGNKTESDMTKIRGINQYSFWDLKFRPVASTKGMVFIGNRWYDIYLLNSEHITNGTSKAGLKIAGGALTNGRLYPKIPLQYGGDNTLTYGSFKWFHACEIAKSHGKELINYSEFQTIAYGVQEQVDASTQDGGGATIQHYANLTSKYGIEQATGTQWIWGNDLIGDTAGTFTQQAVTEGRGTIYSIGNSPNAVILGGDRGNGGNAGSRASLWSNAVWGTNWYIGCRFACDHLQLA